MNARVLYRLTPLLVAIVVVFAAYHAYAVVFAARRGAWAFAVFYGVFSVAGLALARALWNARKQIDRQMRAPTEPGPAAPRD